MDTYWLWLNDVRWNDNEVYVADNSDTLSQALHRYLAEPEIGTGQLLSNTHDHIGMLKSIPLVCYPYYPGYPKDAEYVSFVC